MKNFTLQTNKWIQRFLIVGIWLAIWQGVYSIVGKDILFPSFFDTIKALGLLLITPTFYIDIVVTLYRVLMGSVVSFVLGIGSALVAYRSFFIRECLKPFVITLKSTPVMGIIILALLWFDSGQMPIFVCFLMCYPVVYTNVLTGFQSVDQELLEMSRIYCVKRRYVLRDIYLPHALPYIKSAISLIIGLAFKVVIAAEVLAVPKYSMGYHLLNAKVYLETDMLFAWLVVIVLLSTVCEKGIAYLLGNRGDKIK